MLRGILISLVALAAWTVPAFAQMAVYDGWTDLDGDPPSTQSTGGAETDLEIERALQRGRMRPVRALRDNDLLRRLGKPVGRITMALTGGSRKVVACTATLIADDMILTNRHCIVDNPHGRVTSARMKLGYLAADQKEGMSNYSITLRPLEVSEPLDYAIHRVEGNPGKAWGVATLAPGRVIDNRQSLFILHHPKGHSQHVSLACETGDPAVSGVDVRHTCDTFQGSSGAPVFDFELRQVVGLHYRTYGPGAPKGAKRLAAIAQQSAILQGLAKAQQPSAPRVASSAEPPQPEANPFAQPRREKQEETEQRERSQREKQARLEQERVAGERRRSAVAPQISGRWRGTYRCQNGTTGAEIEVTQEGREVEGTFSYGWPRFATARFRFSGSYDHSASRFRFSPMQWITRPNSGFKIFPFWLSVASEGTNLKGAWEVNDVGCEAINLEKT